MSSCRDSVEGLAWGDCHGYIAQKSQPKEIFEDSAEEHEEAREAALKIG